MIESQLPPHARERLQDKVREVYSKSTVVRLISGSTVNDLSGPVDAGALIEVTGMKGIHHSDIPALFAAAPDLLEACKAVVQTYRTFRNVPKCDQQWTSIDDDVMEQLERAIEKASAQ